MKQNSAIKKEYGRPGRLPVLLAGLTALLLLAVGTGFAWFVNNREVRIGSGGEAGVRIRVDGDLEISADGEHWGTEINAGPEGVKYFIDVSGNGEVLYYPQSLDAEDQPVLRDGSVKDITGGDGFYRELRLYFRTGVPMDLYLTDGSFVKGFEEYIAGSSSYERESIFGLFSCDGIAGAARVAFLEAEGTGENETLVLKNVWIPNDRIELRRNGTVPSVIPQGASEMAAAGYRYVTREDDGLTYAAYGPEDYAAGRVTVTPGWFNQGGTGILADKTAGRINHAVPLLSFRPAGREETRTLVVRIWFEGTDREADSVFNGGLIQYLLDFTGFTRDEQEVKLLGSDLLIPDGNGGAAPGRALGEKEICIYYSTALQSLACYGPAEQGPAAAASHILQALEYSPDGCRFTSLGTENSLPAALQPGAEEKTVFIRLKETAVKKPGEAVKLLIPAAP